MKNILKPLGLIALLFFTLNSYAGFMPMPIIISSGNSGEMKYNIPLAMLIVLNLIFLMLIIVRMMQFMVKKKAERGIKWYQYVFLEEWGDMNILSLLILGINGMALFICVVFGVAILIN